MDKQIFDTATSFRRYLHTIAELSGKETRTKAALQTFFREHTDFPVCDLGEDSGFYAVYRPTVNAHSVIALRADYDALALPDGGAAHLCGHDGHAASLCAVALTVMKERPDRTVLFLFQPAEEIGTGASACCRLFDREKVDILVGAHNLPSYPFGQVLTKTDTFACASRGMTIRLDGEAAHAAYPELGISPAPAVGHFLSELERFDVSAQNVPLTLLTVIGVQMGEKAFGASAANAEVWLTLRAEQNEDFAKLRQTVIDTAIRLAGQYRLKVTVTEQDDFPATVNDTALTEKLLAITNGQRLSLPMRWSEDFGQYAFYCRTVFFGIGAGDNQPPLHSSGYEYPDRLIVPTADTFYQLIQKLEVN